MSIESTRSRFPYPMLALAALGAASLTGCVSVGVVRATATDRQGREAVIEVSIYDSPKQKKAGILSKSAASIDLLLLEQGREKPVESFSGPTCSKAGLVPGTYRLRVRRTASRDEGAPPREKSVVDKDLRVRAGEIVRADVILTKFPTTAVLIGAGVAAAGIGVASAVAASNLDVFGGGSRKKAKKCSSNVYLDREARKEELPPLLELLRPLPLR